MTREWQLLPHRSDLQQSSERRSANRAVVGLVAQRVRTSVAQAKVSAGQDERVPYVRHTNDALRTRVVQLVILKDKVILSLLLKHTSGDSEKREGKTNCSFAATNKKPSENLCVAIQLTLDLSLSLFSIP